MSEHIIMKVEKFDDGWELDPETRIDLEFIKEYYIPKSCHGARVKLPRVERKDK